MSEMWEDLFEPNDKLLTKIDTLRAEVLGLCTETRRLENENVQLRSEKISLFSRLARLEEKLKERDS